MKGERTLSEWGKIIWQHFCVFSRSFLCLHYNRPPKRKHTHAVDIRLKIGLPTRFQSHTNVRDWIYNNNKRKLILDVFACRVLRKKKEKKPAHIWWSQIRCTRWTHMTVSSFIYNPVLNWGISLFFIYFFLFSFLIETHLSRNPSKVEREGVLALFR